MNTSPAHCVKVASAQYDIGYFENWSAYRDKIQTWVTQACEENAQLLVFPEYASMELTSLFEPEIQQSLKRQLHAMQTLLADFQALYSELAKRHRVYIQAGTFPVVVENGSVCNRAFLFFPDGSWQYQDKLQMTRFEAEQWHVESGDQIRTFETDFGTLGINVCYDSEFPLITRRQVEQGAWLILVPSCTDTLAGYHRVSIGCRARALENQCFVVQSPTVGEAAWSPAVDVNVGAAAVYGPIESGIADDGIIACGPLNRPQWVYATLDSGLVNQARETGQVFNHRDWSKQWQWST